MKVTVLLVDKGTPDKQRGTLNLLNAGWVATKLQLGPDGITHLTPAHSLAVFYEVEHSRCNKPLKLVLELLDEDGHPVELPGPAGPQPIRITNVIKVASPAGLPVASPGAGNTNLELFPGLPLAPGGYRWMVTLDDVHEEHWYARFDVVAADADPVVEFGAPE